MEHQLQRIRLVCTFGISAPYIISLLATGFHTAVRRPHKHIISKLAVIILCWAQLTLGSFNSAFAFYMERKHKMDPVALELISKLAHQPELMSVWYLEYYLGSPANESENGLSEDKCYYWYGTDRGALKYKLEQKEAAPNMVTTAAFTMKVPYSGLTFKEMESKFGKPLKRYYNEESFPTEEYCVAPNTVLSFIQPQNSFEIQEIVICYHGNPLSLPSAQDMRLASSDRRSKAFEYCHRKNWWLGMPVLNAHLSEYPEDLEAHCVLAQALKATSRVNEAISEYRFVLARPSSPEIRQKCIAGLQDLKVLRDDIETEPEWYEFKRVDKGQSFRLAKASKGHNKKDPLRIKPIDPPAEFFNLPRSSRVAEAGVQLR